MRLEAEKIFGVDLDIVMSRPCQKLVPCTVGFMIMSIRERGLNTKNIFLNYHSRNRLTQIKTRVEEHDLSITELNVNVVASLLKLYLSELPGSLFTHKLYEIFLVHCDDIQAISQIIHSKMSVNRRHLAEYLLILLGLVAQNSIKNQMTVQRLALIFAPILLRPERETAETMSEMNRRFEFFLKLLTNLDVIFSNPFGSTIINRSHVPYLTIQRCRLCKFKNQLEKILKNVHDKFKHVVKELEHLENATSLRSVRSFLEKNIKNDQKIQSHLHVPDVYYDSCVTSLESGCWSVIGLRKDMEDRVCLYDDLNYSLNLVGNGLNRALYAIFDGHAGSEVSEMAMKIIPKFIAHSCDFEQANIIQALLKALKKADELIIKKALTEGWRSGSTAIVVTIVGETLYIANLGDSEAILAVMGKGETQPRYVILSKKHSPSDVEEKERIQSQGGTVLRNRIFGRLAISRGLGDVEYKKPLAKTNYLSNDPHTNTHRLTEQDKFILLSCDGLWEKTTYQEAVNFVYQKICDKQNIESICQQLVNLGISNGSKDNISVIIIKLEWKPKSLDHNWIYYTPSNFCSASLCKIDKC